MERVREAQALIHEINMGATAIGTGLNAHPEYAALVTARLAEISGVPVIESQNLVEATQDAGAYVQLSGVLKRVAVKLSKICNDLRLLASGPRAGLHEINLPPMAPGSTIMPGKVNPIIPEVVNQVAFEVIGNDMTVTLAAEAGQLELNVMGPVIAYNLFTSLELLGRACRILTERCITASPPTAKCAGAWSNKASVSSLRSTPTLAMKNPPRLLTRLWSQATRCTRSSWRRVTFPKPSWMKFSPLRT